MDGGGLTAASQQTQQQGQQEDGPQHQQDSRLVALSKEMAQRLRHDPPDGMDGCGFVPVDALVEDMEQRTNGDEAKQVVEIAERDDKGRYQLLDDGSQLRVRAVQGHSVPLPNPLHEPLQADEPLPIAVHATSPENWERIQAAGELRRMSRTHIHFAGEPRHLRADDWACVLLSVDLRAAIAAGVPFCRAANGVVLSEGPIPLKFVQRVKLHELPEDWQREMPNPERLFREELP